MSKEVKVAKLSEGATKVLGVLKTATVAKTVAQLKVDLKMAVNSAHLKALEVRGLATSAEVVLECEHCGAKRKVLAWTVTEAGKTYTEPVETETVAK